MSTLKVAQNNALSLKHVSAKMQGRQRTRDRYSNIAWHTVALFEITKCISFSLLKF